MSLVESWNAEKDRQLGTLGRVGRPPSEKKKVRLNFLFDEDAASDLKNLATIKKTTLTNIVLSCLQNEFESNRRELDLMRAMQTSDTKAR